MPKSNASVISEYVVKLGAEMDNNGLNQLLTAIDTSKLKALGLTAAIGALTTGIYKFISSLTQQQFEMEKLAKQQDKSIKQTRAEQMALKAMGTTLNEIKKDKALKEMYDDLVKFNKELELTNASRAYENVRKLQSAFYKLKSAVNYVLTEIGNHVLTNLEMPMNRIGNKLGKATDWIKTNLTSIATKLGSYITAFAKGIIGIAEAIEKIGQWINSLPAAVKSVGVALGALIALLNSGPLGQILAAVTIIGDLIHDAEVYQWNLNNQKTREFLDESGNPIQVPVGLPDVWEVVLDDSKDTGEKISGVMKRITEALSEGLKDFKVENIGSIFGDPDGDGLVGGIIKWFNNDKETIYALGRALVAWISRAVSVSGGTLGEVAGQIVDALFGEGTVSEELHEGDGSAGATFIAAFGGFIGTTIKRAEEGDSLSEAIKKGLGDGAVYGLITAILSNIVDKNGELKVKWEDVGPDLEAAGKSILGIFTRALQLAGDIGEFLINALADTLLGTDGTGISLGADSGTIQNLTGALGMVFKKWGENQTLVDGISGAVTGLLMGGNLVESLALGIGAAFAGARREAMKKSILDSHKYDDDRELLENLDTLADGMIQQLYDGLSEEYKNDNTYWSNLFSNLGSAGEDLVTGLWDALVAGARGVGDLGGILLNTLLQGIADIIAPGVEMGLSDNAIVKGIATGIGTAMVGGNFFTSLLAGITAGVVALQDMVDSDPEVNDLWEAVKKSSSEFWAKIVDLWEGPVINNETGARDSNKGLKNLFLKLWEGDNGDSGLRSWLSSIWDTILNGAKSLFQSICDAAGPYFDLLMFKLEAAWDNSPLARKLDELLGWAGIDLKLDENTKGQNTLIMDDEGNVRSLDYAAGNVVNWGNGDGTYSSRTATDEDLIRGLKRYRDYKNVLNKFGLPESGVLENDYIGNTDSWNKSGGAGGLFSDFVRIAFLSGNSDYISTILEMKEEVDKLNGTDFINKMKEIEMLYMGMAINYDLQNDTNHYETKGLPWESDRLFSWLKGSKYEISEGSATFSISNPEDVIGEGYDKTINRILNLFSEHGILRGNYGVDIGEDGTLKLRFDNESASDLMAILKAAEETGLYSTSKDFKDKYSEHNNESEDAQGLLEDLVMLVYGYNKSQVYTNSGSQEDWYYFIDNAGVANRIKRNKDGSFDFNTLQQEFFPDSSTTAYASKSNYNASWEEQKYNEGWEPWLDYGMVDFYANGKKHKIQVDKDGNYNFDSILREYENTGEFRKVSESYSDLIKTMYEKGYINDLQTRVDTKLNPPDSASIDEFKRDVTAKVGEVEIDTKPKWAFRQFGAQGGRYASATDITLGEDGTEYLIPITKPERAISLINQMLNEMGSSAVSRIFSGLGLGQSGTVGASMMSLDTALSGMSMSPVYNISAPVNINVQSTGADAKEIGSAVYDMAERHLIRNVMGVYA